MVQIGKIIHLVTKPSFKLEQCITKLWHMGGTNSAPLCIPELKYPFIFILSSMQSFYYFAFIWKFMYLESSKGHKRVISYFQGQIIFSGVFHLFSIWFFALIYPNSSEGILFQCIFVTVGPFKGHFLGPYFWPLLS